MTYFLIAGYLSVRHSLLRMHSQLRSAPNGRQSAQGPIDLSLYRSSRQTPKVTTRSSSSAATTVETVPTITPLITSPTRTIYGSSISSSSTSSKPATAQYNHEEKRKGKLYIYKENFHFKLQKQKRIAIILVLLMIPA